MITVYHNTRCSKSRSALQLLDEKQVPYQVRLYLQEPLTLKELRALLKKLQLKPSGLLRKSEDLYKELNDGSLTEQDWLKLMVKHPVLIERPVVETDDRAVIARPTERLLELL